MPKLFAYFLVKSYNKGILIKGVDKMAKSKVKFDLTACVTFVASLIGLVMFFLPNLYLTLTVGPVSETYTASGWQMFMGVFGSDNAGLLAEGLFSNFVSGEALAYVVGIALALAAIALVACMVLSVLQILGVKCNFSLVGKIAIVASILMVVALVFALIRFGQMDAEGLALGYGLIVGLIASIATAVVPMVLKK